MTNHSDAVSLTLEPANNHRLADLCGPQNEHIQQLEDHFQVEIHQRGNSFRIMGPKPAIALAEQALRRLYSETGQHEPLSLGKIFLLLKEPITTMGTTKHHQSNTSAVIHTQHETIRPRGVHQEQYVRAIREYDINFAVGPAGTGKTYLAVACALEALQQQNVHRLIFVRPAVEAGENLGFLPGDLQEKITPYLRPIYDAIYEMIGYEQASKLIEQNVIEIAPLAYMRGRTLNDAFIILDEAQNTTIEQMKMFLTRIGFGSTAVITGDMTQVDLRKDVQSGLIHAMSVLKDIEDISFTRFDAKDSVRHPLVQSIIEAYDKDEV